MRYKFRKHIIIPMVTQIKARSSEMAAAALHTHQSRCGRMPDVKLVVNVTAKCGTIRNVDGGWLAWGWG